MTYMLDAPAKRLHPQATYRGAETVLTIGISYYKGEFPTKPGPAFGRVARYAWGLDYHEVISKRLEQLVATIESMLGGVRVATAVDSKPLMERALAQSASLGFLGKNTLLIIPRQLQGAFHVGSWIFLAEILLSAPLEQTLSSPSTEAPAGCGSCTRCMTECPTGAFDRPYFVKSERCISYLNIENKGWIPTEMRPRLSDWIFGCDVCQEVCPFNARAFKSRWPEFESDQGAGPWVSLKEMLSIPDQPAFKKRWGHTPLARPKRRGLLRNALVVAGNSRDGNLIPSILALLEDSEPILRGHAFWALNQLSPSAAKAAANQKWSSEIDADVRAELDLILR